MENIRGTVDTIVFASTDNRFTVLKMTPEKRSTKITVILNSAAPLVGQLLEVEGEWTQHPKFGQQFKAVSCRAVAPTEISGIEKFLASGAISGIGPAMAKRIVAMFGEKTLDILSSPQELLKVSGIGKKTAEKIAASYQEQSELSEIMVWLENHGISSTYAGKIFAKYGSFAIDIMEKDIYRLFQDIDGIGFLTADKIAFNLGIQRDDAKRISSGIDYALMQLCANGHCCVPEAALIAKTAKILQLETIAIRHVLNERIQSETLNTENYGGELLIYPPYLYYAEKKVAKRLLELQRSTKELDEANIGLFIKVWEKENRIHLAQNQQEAVKACLHHGVFVLTGGPGTGKTTVVKGILSILNAQGLKIRLAAPTGRAAKRLSETTGRKALTIHRLLEANNLSDNAAQTQLGFAKDIDDQLDALQTGADDYIPKPFSLQVLAMKANNIIRNRRRIMERYSRMAEMEPQNITFNEADEEFIQKAAEVVKKNLSNETFSTEEFAKELTVSRSSLHLKIKAITGLSALDFIRKIRFNEACELLKENRWTIAEISYKVGFSSPSYFSTSFKRHFGCLPTEYQKNNS